MSATQTPLIAIVPSHVEREVEFAGIFGKRLVSGQWMMNIHYGMDVQPVQPTSITPQIRECFERDDQFGVKQEDVKYLLVSRHAAVVLFLEGLISVSSIIARRTFRAPYDDYPQTDIPDVTILGRTLTIRVQNYPLHVVATGDKDGNVIGINGF